MKSWISGAIGAALLALGPTVGAHAEILAMLNYETKPADSLKALKLSGPMERREGIAIIDVDPKSPNFGKWIADFPLPPDLVAHHIFYDRSQTKAYISALGQPLLHVMDLTANPYRLKQIAVPDCMVGEDVIFSEDNSTWYLTCMGSNKVIVGDVQSDEIKKALDTPERYPHGIALHSGIDRLLTSSTVRHTDLGDPGDKVSVIEASTGKALGSVHLSKKPSPAGEAPVEILFVPGSNPPVAYVTNMYGGSLWTMTWNEAKSDFDAAEAFDFAPLKAGVPLEIYFNAAVTRMYVTTAKPGQLHIFDVSADAAKPKLLTSLTTGEGAHHVAITKDEKLAFVQNSLLNLPGMSAGTITVVDLEKNEAIGQIDTLAKAGYNPNLIVLLPEWNSPAGH
ncbi:MAG: YncE family protein [Kiloniellales bacterium]